MHEEEEEEAFSFILGYQISLLHSPQSSTVEDGVIAHVLRVPERAARRARIVGRPLETGHDRGHRHDPLARSPPQQARPTFARLGRGGALVLADHNAMLFWFRSVMSSLVAI